ncbi:MAG: hypothetical protein LBR36_06535 [Bacteroidales bacterium]|jgi:hypothetical protein|nr:hypothetical protein [Bacteroidales bacterium]
MNSKERTMEVDTLQSNANDFSIDARKDAGSGSQTHFKRFREMISLCHVPPPPAKVAENQLFKQILRLC